MEEELIYFWEKGVHCSAKPIALQEAQNIWRNGGLVYAHSSHGYGLNPIRWDRNSNMLQLANIVGEWFDFSLNSLTSMMLETPKLYRKVT